MRRNDVGPQARGNPSPLWPHYEGGCRHSGWGSDPSAHFVGTWVKEGFVSSECPPDTPPPHRGGFGPPFPPKLRLMCKIYLCYIFQQTEKAPAQTHGVRAGAFTV
ncbi:hypothetical protein CE91St41_23710 [Oscillospiraceae bacterium]|nr:hypothetical protein CE91St40_13830 [Oscillospiraceae bacterium]BDF75482.1 hypothetical protein CE91St41_23710 [Oscillospiraceae bacterium]